MSSSKLVYSTDAQQYCPSCGKITSKCKCKDSVVLGDGNVKVWRETKGRKGKGVTLVAGLPLDKAELKSTGKKLKQKCGTGGTIKDGVIEIQGDHVELLLNELKQMGYSPKKVGG